MGKKYIIELEEVPFIQHFKNGAWETIYRVKGFNSLVFDWNGLNMLTPYTEPDLERVKADAYLAGLKDGQGVTIESQQNNAFNDGYKKCLKDLEQVRKEAYEQGQKDLRESCVPQDEEAYGFGYHEGFQQGRGLAWEAAKKIWEYDLTTLREIFGEGIMRMDFFMKFTASEVIEKIRAYEQVQKEQEQEEEEPIRAEDVMRQYLKEFCKKHDCEGCVLNASDFVCGRVADDEEVRRAYAEVLQKMREN